MIWLARIRAFWVFSVHSSDFMGGEGVGKKNFEKKIQ